MSIRFTDLQVILPRTVQAGDQAQAAVAQQSVNQHYEAVSLQAAVAREQNMVRPGNEAQGSQRLSRRRDGGSGLKDQHSRRSRREDGEKQGSNAPESEVDGLGANIDVRA